MNSQQGQPTDSFPEPKNQPQQQQPPPYYQGETGGQQGQSPYPAYSNQPGYQDYSKQYPYSYPQGQQPPPYGYQGPQYGGPLHPGQQPQIVVLMQPGGYQTGYGESWIKPSKTPKLDSWLYSLGIIFMVAFWIQFCAACEPGVDARFLGFSFGSFIWQCFALSYARKESRAGAIILAVIGMVMSALEILTWNIITRGHWPFELYSWIYGIPLGILFSVKAAKLAK